MNKVFCKEKVKTNTVYPGSSEYTELVLAHCEKAFATNSTLYGPIVNVIADVFRADGALAAEEKLSQKETQEIIGAIQQFIRERTLTVGDQVINEKSFANTSADGSVIQLNRKLRVSYIIKGADETQQKRAVAFGTLKLIHEMMRSLAPFILEMSFQRKRANGVVDAKKSDVTPLSIGTKKTGRSGKVSGDMGFALEEQISGGRRFYSRFALRQIGSIEVAERNKKRQWIKKSLEKQSEEELVDCVLASNIDFGKLATLCAAIVEKKAKEPKEKGAESFLEDSQDDEEDEIPVLEVTSDEEDEGEFPVLQNDKLQMTTKAQLAEEPVEPSKKTKKPKAAAAEMNKVFCKEKVKTDMVYPHSNGAYTKLVLTHCEHAFATNSTLYGPIVNVIADVFRADGALTTEEKLSQKETHEIIEAIQRFIRERTLTIGDQVINEKSIANTSADGSVIHLNRKLRVSYMIKGADATQQKRAVAFGTLKFIHEMMRSLAPFILEMSFQRKQANGVTEAKKLDATPLGIGTKKTGKSGKVSGDMGFALEEQISGGRRFYPRSTISKIGSIQVAERNKKGQWIKKSLEKQSEEELVDCVLASNIDFGKLATLCAAIVEKKAKEPKEKGAESFLEDSQDEDEGDEIPVFEVTSDEDEGEFPILEKYDPRRKK